MKDSTDTIKQKVFKALELVIDPELSIDIVNLGLIYDVVVVDLGDSYQVSITMTLTTPGCPLAHVFDKLVKDAVMSVSEIDDRQQISIDLTFDPPWMPTMISQEARAELGFD